MARPNTIVGSLHVTDKITSGGAKQKLARSDLTQDTLASYQIPWTAWRIWDAYHTNLPGTAATDDLALIGGTFATASPTIQTEDLKTAGATAKYARATIQLPPEYDAAETVIIRFHAGMKTTVADTSATLDLQAYESDGEEGISSDLCTTAATTINSLTMADIDFTITATALVAGDHLDIRAHMAINDGAESTAVIGIIGEAFLLCDIRG